MMTSTNPNQTIWADAHVHIYDCYDLEEFLDAALKNFNATAQKSGYSQAETALMFLTETSKDHYFQKLIQSTHKDGNSNLNLKDWSLFKTGENCSVYAKHSTGQGIFIFAGRQIVTAEDLEVLALLTAEEFADGLPIEKTIQQVISNGGIPVLPWGFGKWMGERGTIINRLLEQKESFPLFLGDNGGRPTFWSQPIYFKQAEALGFKILPGTDPLPFASESWRPGSFGFALQGTIDPNKPAQSIKEILLDPNTQLQSYGTQETPLRFIRNQIAMQLVKRMRKKG
jgi:hypothetical protein